MTTCIYRNSQMGKTMFQNKSTWYTCNYMPFKKSFFMLLVNCKLHEGRNLAHVGICFIFWPE